jgi:hypothetical protein
MADEGTLKVFNNSTKTITVSINKWDNNGNSATFRIESKSSEVWARTDLRGYVMYLERPGVASLPYYVLDGDYIEVEENAVKANNTPITTISRAARP